MRFLAGFILGLWLGAVNSELILQLLAALSQKITFWLQSFLQTPPAT